MRASLTIRLAVDEHTAAALDGQSRIANWLYNRLLEEANERRWRFRFGQKIIWYTIKWTEWLSCAYSMLILCRKTKNKQGAT